MDKKEILTEEKSVIPHLFLPIREILVKDKNLFPIVKSQILQILLKLLELVK